MSKSIWPFGGLRVVVSSLFVLTLALTAPVHGAIPGGGDNPPPSTTAYFEQGILIRSGEVVQALGPNLMGDSVNEYSGGLEFTQTADGEQMHGIVTHVIDQDGRLRARFHGLGFEPLNLVIYVNALTSRAQAPHNHAE